MQDGRKAVWSIPYVSVVFTIYNYRDTFILLLLLKNQPANLFLILFD